MNQDDKPVREPEPWEKAFAYYMQYAESKHRETGAMPTPAMIFRAGYLAGAVDEKRKEGQSEPTPEKILLPGE